MYTIWLPYVIRHARSIDKTTSRCPSWYERYLGSSLTANTIYLFESEPPLALYDVDGDRLVDSYSVTTIDQSARLHRASFYDVSGSPLLSSSLYSYNAQDRLISWQVDSDGDGAIDFGQHYAYDERGNETEIKHDEDGNGIVDAITAQEYDQKDRLVLARYDDEADGIWDWLSTSLWLDSVNDETEIFDRHADGTIDWVKRTVYDARRRPISRDVDRSGHKYPVDQWDERTEWDYDEAGRNIQRRWYQDGVIHDLDTLEYDAFGRMVVRHLMRGPVRSIERWTYSCDP